MSNGKEPSDHLLFVDPSPVARRLLWHLFSIGHRKITAPDHHDPYEKPGAHLFWVQSGEGELEHETGRFALRRGRKVWLVDMSRPRTYIPSPKRHLTIAGFRFGGPALEVWHEEIKGDENSEFVLDDFNYVRGTQTTLLQLVRIKPQGWEWQVHVEITNMLGKLFISRNLLVSPQQELPEPVVRVLNAIASNPLRDWKARELAAVGRVSYSGLRALFHKAGQGTIHQHIQRARLNQACQLLADDRLTIKDVAAQLNFSSEFYFSHFFRHHTGMSATEYRKRYHGQS